MNKEKEKKIISFFTNAINITIAFIYLISMIAAKDHQVMFNVLSAGMLMHIYIMVLLK